MFFNIFFRKSGKIVTNVFNFHHLRHSNTSTTSSNTVENITELFFSDKVQDLLKKLTRVDIGKVYRVRREGKKLSVPVYQFMTDDDVQKAKQEAIKKLDEKLQMPPVLDEREEVEDILLKDNNLVGYSDTKFVFTDITFGMNDRERVIVVREPDGTLRKARWSERDRINQIYFPKLGRNVTPSKLFSEDNLQKLLSQGEYEFILDSACCQFEPDDPAYIKTCSTTYDAVDRDSAYNNLRSTRHYGPLVLHLVRYDKIDNLLMENLVTDRLEDAVWLLSLYQIVHSTAESKAFRYNPGNELAYIKDYIEHCSKDKDKLGLTLQTYKEYLNSPKSENLNESLP